VSADVLRYVLASGLVEHLLALTARCAVHCSTGKRPGTAGDRGAEAPSAAQRKKLKAALRVESNAGSKQLAAVSQLVLQQSMELVEAVTLAAVSCGCAREVGGTQVLTYASAVSTASAPPAAASGASPYRAKAKAKGAPKGVTAAAHSGMALALQLQYVRSTCAFQPSQELDQQLQLPLALAFRGPAAAAATEEEPPPVELFVTVLCALLYANSPGVSPSGSPAAPPSSPAEPGGQAAPPSAELVLQRPVLSVMRCALSTLSAVAQLDLGLLQGCLGSAPLQSEFLHLCGRLVAFASARLNALGRANDGGGGPEVDADVEEMEAVLHCVLVLIGFYALQVQIGTDRVPASCSSTASATALRLKILPYLLTSSARCCRTRPTAPRSAGAAARAACRCCTGWPCCRRGTSPTGASPPRCSPRS
jgi:hypothetical protein